MGWQLQGIATNPLPPAVSQLSYFPKPRDSGRDRAQVPLLPFHSCPASAKPSQRAAAADGWCEHLLRQNSCSSQCHSQSLLHEGQKLAAPPPPLLWALFIERCLLLPFFLFPEASLPGCRQTVCTPAGSSQIPLAARGFISEWFYSVYACQAPSQCSSLNSWGNCRVKGANNSE